MSLGISLVLAGVFWIANQQGWLNQTTQNAQESAPGSYRIVSFEDGDTISVDMNGTTERIRMIGVDTPETQDPRVPVQCFGKAASSFTKTLIGSSTVRLESDQKNTDRDRYNRLLRYVFLADGRLVNAEIIKAGYGFAYTLFPFEKLDEFRDYERQAREQSKGLWDACDVQETDGKRTTNPV